MQEPRPCRTCAATFTPTGGGRWLHCPSCRERSLTEIPKTCRNCSTLFWLPRRSKGCGPYVRYCSTCHPERERFATLRKVGTTDRAYKALLAGQAGGCAICGEPCRTGRSLAVDHDHSCCPGRTSCGKCVRGLLCADCNNGLGRFRDDPALLARAIDYLAQSRGQLFGERSA